MKQTISERKKLIRELDKLVSEIVRYRDGKCVTLGDHCSEQLTASHWQKRSKQAVRFDLRNVNAQCSSCNNRHNYYTSYYDAFMLKKYGGKVCLELAEKASSSWKWTVPELREIRDKLEREFAVLKR